MKRLNDDTILAPSDRVQEIDFLTNKGFSHKPEVSACNASRDFNENQFSCWEKELRLLRLYLYVYF